MSNDSGRHLDMQICRMICPISAAMVGVCLTGVSLIRVVISYNHQQTIADDLIAIDAIGFLIATLTSYFALRAHSSRRLYMLESVADIAFIASMVLLTIASVFITYAITFI